MSEVSVCLWNGGRVFSDELRYGEFADAVYNHLQTDVLIVPEALNSSGEDIDPNFLKTLGYDQEATVAYKDHVRHPSDEQYLRVLFKKELDAAGKPIRLGSRNGISLSLGEPAMKFILAHFDDRDEPARQGTAMSAIFDHVSPEEPTAIIGDLNSARVTDLRAILLANLQNIYRTIVLIAGRHGWIKCLTEARYACSNKQVSVTPILISTRLYS